MRTATMLLDKVLLAALATATLAKPILRRQTGTIRGANLGGWLLLEPWITPSIFQAQGGGVIDEYTLCQNALDAESILQSHWASWVTEGDIQKIAGAGFNLVRIPVGYWAFEKYEDDPYIQGAGDYLDQAVVWAVNAGLQVWIDLHGSPRSQNGYDNSGQRTSSPQWTAGDTLSFTEGIISQINDRYGSNPAVVGIGLVNEPLLSALPGGRDAVSSFYSAAAPSVSTGVVISDGFDNPSSWNGFLPSSIIDHHEYQVFTNELVALDYQGHVDAVYSRASEWASGADHNIVCGEWTAAMTDCAPAVNGYGIGARYDGTYSKQNPDGSYDSSTAVGSCANKNFIDQWDDAMKTATTNYIQAQLDVYENQIGGWIFWNFKTEAAAEWDLFRLLDNGVWPS